jgi:hypothetical protein
VSAESQFLEPSTAGIADYGRAWGQAKSQTSDNAANEIKSLTNDGADQSQGVGQAGESVGQIRLTHGEAARQPTKPRRRPESRAPGACSKPQAQASDQGLSRVSRSANEMPMAESTKVKWITAIIVTILMFSRLRSPLR